MSVVAEITDEYGIPWSKAQELVQQAKENLEVTGMKDGRKKKEIKKEKKAIKEEAVRLFVSRTLFRGGTEETKQAMTIALAWSNIKRGICRRAAWKRSGSSV